MEQKKALIRCAGETVQDHNKLDRNGSMVYDGIVELSNPVIFALPNRFENGII